MEEAGKKTDPPDSDNNENRAKKYIKKLLPWFILCVLFYFLFKMVPSDKVFAELLEMDKLKILSLFGLSIIFILGISIIDGISMWYGFSLFGVKLKIKEILLIRSAMMVLASIATLVGQAALGTLMTKKYGVPAGKSAGMVLFTIHAGNLRDGGPYHNFSADSLIT